MLAWCFRHPRNQKNLPAHADNYSGQCISVTQIYILKVLLKKWSGRLDYFFWPCLIVRFLEKVDDVKLF